MKKKEPNELQTFDTPKKKPQHNIHSLDNPQFISIVAWCQVFCFFSMKRLTASEMVVIFSNKKKTDDFFNVKFWKFQKCIYFYKFLTLSIHQLLCVVCICTQQRSFFLNYNCITDNFGLDWIASFAFELIEFFLRCHFEISLFFSKN